MGIAYSMIFSNCPKLFIGTRETFIIQGLDLTDAVNKHQTIQNIYNFIKNIVRHGEDNEFAIRITSVEAELDYSERYSYGERFKYTSLSEHQYFVEIKYISGGCVQSFDQIKRDLVYIIENYFVAYKDKLNTCNNLVSQYVHSDLSKIISDYIGFNELYDM